MQHVASIIVTAALALFLSGSLAAQTTRLPQVTETYTPGPYGPGPATYRGVAKDGGMHWIRTGPDGKVIEIPRSRFPSIRFTNPEEAEREGSAIELHVKDEGTHTARASGGSSPTAQAVANRLKWIRYLRSQRELRARREAEREDRGGIQTTRSLEREEARQAAEEAEDVESAPEEERAEPRPRRRGGIQTTRTLGR